MKCWSNALVNRTIMTQSTRQFPRYAIEAAVEVVSMQGTTHGRTKNVSRGGLAAYVDQPVRPGQRVQVRLSLVFAEDSFSEPLLLPARIVWCTQLGEKYQLGTAFMPMTVEQRNYLGMFLRYLEEGLEQHRALREEQEPTHDHDDDPFA